MHGRNRLRNNINKLFHVKMAFNDFISGCVEEFYMFVGGSLVRNESRNSSYLTIPAL